MHRSFDRRLDAPINSRKPTQAEGSRDPGSHDSIEEYRLDHDDYR